MEHLSDAVRKIRVLLFGERQRGMPENRVFLDKRTLFTLFQDWEQQDNNLRVLYERNQQLDIENLKLKAVHDVLSAQVEKYKSDNEALVGMLTDKARIHISINEAELTAKAIESSLDAVGAPVTKFAKEAKDFVDGFNFCASLLLQHAAKVRQGGAE